jgi:hypothetical protein
MSMLVSPQKSLGFDCRTYPAAVQCPPFVGCHPCTSGTPACLAVSSKYMQCCLFQVCAMQILVATMQTFPVHSRSRSCHSLPVYLCFPRASDVKSHRSCPSLCDAEAFQCCHSVVHICGRHATEIEFNTDCMQQECALLKSCSWRTICNFSSRSGSQKTAHRKRWDYLKQRVALSENAYQIA